MKSGDSQNFSLIGIVGETKRIPILWALTSAMSSAKKRSSSRRRTHQKQGCKLQSPRFKLQVKPQIISRTYYDTLHVSVPKGNPLPQMI